MTKKDKMTNMGDIIMSKKIKKAIIPAAGLGTRFLPVTKAKSKEMLPIVDKPAIQYIVEEAIASGIEEILIITGRHKTCIEIILISQWNLKQNWLKIIRTIY